MRLLTLKPPGISSEAVLVLSLRAVRGLLVLVCWALFLVALIASGLAELAGRSAAHIRVR